MLANADRRDAAILILQGGVRLVDGDGGHVVYRLLGVEVEAVAVELGLEDAGEQQQFGAGHVRQGDRRLKDGRKEVIGHRHGLQTPEGPARGPGFGGR